MAYEPDEQEEPKDSPETNPDVGSEPDTTTGARVPEDLQVKCHELIDSCETEECLDYIQDALDKKKQELGKSGENESADAATPQEFSAEGMPGMS
jgi:hypothetical protein